MNVLDDNNGGDVGLYASGDVSALPLDQAMSGYSAAHQSMNRGQIWWASNDSRDELDSWSRREIVRKMRALYANSGIARRLVRGPAEFIGYVTPQAKTTDAEWNSLAEKVFENRCGAKGVFDVAGKFNYKTAQLMLNRNWLRDGDSLTVMTATAAGGAQFAFYEGPQFQTPAAARKGKQAKDWHDGVRINRFSRHVEYGLSESGSDRVTRVRAQDTIYFGEFDNVHHPRAIPPLSYAINDIQDLVEIRTYNKAALKLNSVSGVVRTQGDVDKNRHGQEGLAGAVQRNHRPANSATGDAAKSFTTEEVYAGNQINRLAPGEDLKVISDPRPTDSQRNLEEDCYRAMSVGSGVPFEVLFKAGGLTGPGVRVTLEQTNRWIKTRQQALEEWCRVVWLRTIAMEIKAGRLRACEDEQWWQVEFVPQRSMTIDRGQSKQRLDEITAGAGTMADWYREMYGADWRDKYRQRHEEVKFAKELCGDDSDVTFNELFPPRQGAAVAAESKPEPRNVSGEEKE